MSDAQPDIASRPAFTFGQFFAVFVTLVVAAMVALVSLMLLFPL